MLARCDECGFDPSRLALGELAEEVRRLGSRYRAPLTRLLPGEEDGLLRRRPEPAVWSAIEYVAHVRDVFRIFEQRIDRILAEERPELEVVDHDRLVERGSYRQLDPGRVATEVLESAQQLADRLDHLADGDWERYGIRNGESRTVGEIAQRATHEGRHHLLDVGRSLRSARGR